MTKCLYSSILIITFLFAFTTLSYATAQELISVPKSELTAQQKEKFTQQTTIEKVGSWVGLGKEIGTAVDESLGALTERANDFSNTRVGLYTMILVAYKIIGKDIVQLLFAVFLSLIFFPLFIYSFLKNCIRRRVVDSKRILEDYTEEIIYGDSISASSYETSIWGHVFIFLVFIGVLSIVIFV